MPANGHRNGENGLLDGSSTPEKTLQRAEETDDLIDAVKSLIIPYIRAADEATHTKATGRPQRDSNDCRRNALVEPHSPSELVECLGFSLPQNKGQGKDGLMKTIQDVLRYSVNTWDQGFLDKLTASTNAVGVVSEMVLAALNTNVHVYRVSPSLTVVEKVTARALASYFGFKGPHAGGITCQGGSASNLTSLVTARGVLYPDTKLLGCQGYRFAIFTSAQGHFSVEKAAVTCGMGVSSVVCVPVDKVGRMIPAALRSLVLESQAQGRTPLYVNATAGTTVLGAYDPLREIKAVCDEFGMWLHVDGSWGGSVCFSAKHGHKLDGSELADSVTINPQKMLNVPMTCSFLLTNDVRRFHAANSLRAGYLFHGQESDDDVWDLADLTLQCGRRGDSLKLALAWVYYGSHGFEQGIDHAFDMAQRLTTLVDKSPSFELVSTNPPPCLQVCFYHAPGGRAPDNAEENTTRTREMVQKLVVRGFMVDFAPGPKGYLFRVVVNCQTLEGTVDGLFKALYDVGQGVCGVDENKVSACG
ncbi:glutamate decarboxylase, putative [Metarhizium acridum CQMa 102]|uniref:Glutamate decarboxylase, putative n=1 Tax=Metarhizium acridum (strain CQMa 102) TaxID=655827 RepID=E9EGA0_METAQ|nr:glutamate decarboxylase, putative [Metarhizium acridum CQMa 102]EFY85052.1 glutamate decarboxylase, putative [Metarhizium acridum CQMa 102]